MKKLSRVEMKNVKGGRVAPGGSCGANQVWLVCATPNGTQMWCRSSGDGDASSICQGIYPAYSNVSGNWAPVIVVGV